jgi:hypothetical protein
MARSDDMNDKKRPFIFFGRAIFEAPHHGRDRLLDDPFIVKVDTLVVSSVDQDHLSTVDWQQYMRKYRKELAHVRSLNRHTRLRYLIRLENERGANPPALAEFLLGALSPKRNAEALLGDLEERFTRDCKSVGTERAQSRYWAAAVRTLLPLAWRALKKAGLSALVAGALRGFLK